MFDSYPIFAFSTSFSHVHSRFSHTIKRLTSKHELCSLQSVCVCVCARIGGGQGESFVFHFISEKLKGGAFQCFAGGGAWLVWMWTETWTLEQHQTNENFKGQQACVLNPIKGQWQAWVLAYKNKWPVEEISTEERWKCGSDSAGKRGTSLAAERIYWKEIKLLKTHILPNL